jgi:cytochrome P450
MKEHPVFIPTSVGAVGGIVAEPDDPSAAAILLPGTGGSGRAGVNAFWTRVSRELVAHGLLTLRFDYPYRGNGASPLARGVDAEARVAEREDPDLTVACDATTWFRERLEGEDIFLAGECHGGRLALELLPRVESVAGIFVVVPYLRDRFVPLWEREQPGAADDDIQILDPFMLASLREHLGAGRPAWVLSGGDEGADPFRLRHRLGDVGQKLEVEVAPGFKLHPVAAPDVQAEVRKRLMRRMLRELSERSASVGVGAMSESGLPRGPDIAPSRQSARFSMRQLSFLQEARDAYGEVFTLRLRGEEPLVVLGHPELAKQVFSAPEEVLSAAGGNRPILSALLGEGSLFMLGGEQHLVHRRILLPPLHGERLARQEQTMREIAAAQIETWPQDERFPALPRLRALALEVVTVALFGPAEGARRARLREALSTLRLPMNARDGAKPEYGRAVRRAESLVEEAIAERRAEPHTEHADVLSLLLDARDAVGEPLSELEIRDELVTLVAAGMETTAGSLAWALERLTRDRRALSRAADDAAEGGGPYLEAVIHETLRMRPVVPMTTRLSRRPIELDRHLIPAGVRIFVSAFLIHYREDVYSDPMAFRPERFLEDPPGTYTWIPFGGGVRRCIGASFALQEMRVILAALLARLTPRASDADPEGVRNRAILSTPARGGEILLEARSAAGQTPKTGAAW